MNEEANQELHSPSEMPEVTISGDMAFNLTMASKNLDKWFKNNPQLIKSREVEKINFCRHIMRAFSRFYNEALLGQDAVPLPEELEHLAYLGPAASRYVVCTSQPIEPNPDLPAGGVGYVWGFLTEYGEACGDPVVCSKDGIPAGPDLSDPKARDRRDYNWLFTLPERKIIEDVG